VDLDDDENDPNFGDGDIEHTVLRGSFDRSSILANESLDDWGVSASSTKMSGKSREIEPDFVSSTGGGVPVSWRFLLSLFRLAIHPHFVPTDIRSALQPPFPFAGNATNIAAVDRNSSSNDEPSVALATNGRMTYCTSDATGSGSVCVQPSTVCVVASHTAAAYQNAGWLPPRCTSPQRFLFALLWASSAISILGVFHHVWPVLRAHRDNRCREIWRIVLLVMLTVQCVAGIIVAEAEAEAALLYRVILCIILMRGFRHWHQIIYAKLLPMLNRETLVTRATYG